MDEDSERLSDQLSERIEEYSKNEDDDSNLSNIYRASGRFRLVSIQYF